MDSLKCDVCGRFVSYADLDSGRAVRRLVTPDSHLSREEYETYHVSCDERGPTVDTRRRA